MTTANPRITVTLTPAVAAVMKAMSAATGNSQSSIVAELLEGSLPVFERMVRVLQAAKDVRGRVNQDIVAGMETIQAKLEKQLGLGLELMDEHAAPLLDKAEQIKRRGAGEARAARTAATGRAVGTPISNRGVTPHPTKGKKPGEQKVHGRPRGGRCPV